MSPSMAERSEGQIRLSGRVLSKRAREKTQFQKHSSIIGVAGRG